MAPIQRAQQLLLNRGLTLAKSNDEAVCHSHSGDELNNTESNKDGEKRTSYEAKTAVLISRRHNVQEAQVPSSAEVYWPI